MSALSFDDIEMALYFISSQGMGMNEAFLCRDTGEQRGCPQGMHRIDELSQERITIC